MKSELANQVTSSTAACLWLARDLLYMICLTVLILSGGILPASAQYSINGSFEVGYGISGASTSTIYLRSTPLSNPITIVVLNNSASSNTLKVESGFTTFSPDLLLSSTFNLVSNTSFNANETKTFTSDLTIGNLKVTNATSSTLYFPIGSAASGVNSVVNNPPGYFTATRSILLKDSNGNVLDSVTLLSTFSVDVINASSGIGASPPYYTNAKSFTPVTIYLAVDGANYYNANNPRPGTSKPKITKQPVSASKSPNTQHTFSLTASNATSYQWYRVDINGDLQTEVLLAGQTNPTLTVTSGDGTLVTEDHYYCAISNAAGTTKSDLVTLFVNQPFVDYTYHVTGFNSTGFASKVYFISAAGAYEIEVPAFGMIDSKVQTKQAPENTTIGIDLNGAEVGPNTKIPATNVVTQGASFQVFLDIIGWESEAFTSGNPPPTPKGTVEQGTMTSWDSNGNQQETQTYEYTPYDNTGSNNNPGTVIQSPNGQYQQIGDQPYTFNIPLGSGVQPYNGPSAEEIGQAVEAHDTYKGPSAEEIAEAIDQKNQETNQQLKDDILNAKDDSQAQPQAEGVKDAWLDATPLVGSYNFGSYSSDPSFWNLEFKNPMGLGSASWHVDLNPYTKVWFVGLANFIKVFLSWVATVTFVHQTWKLFRESFIYSLQTPQTQGIDGGALGGTVSLPSGYGYALAITVLIASFIPIILAVFATFPTGSGLQGFSGLEVIMTSAIFQFCSFKPFCEAWILVNLMIPFTHFITLWALWWVNSFLSTGYAMFFTTFVRWLVK